MTVTIEKILPCPFCGGEAIVEELPASVSGVTFSVGCVTDGGDGQLCMGYQSLTVFDRRSDAIAAWNKRTPLRKR